MTTSLMPTLRLIDISCNTQLVVILIKLNNDSIAVEREKNINLKLENNSQKKRTFCFDVKNLTANSRRFKQNSLRYCRAGNTATLLENSIKTFASSWVNERNVPKLGLLTSKVFSVYTLKFSFYLSEKRPKSWTEFWRQRAFAILIKTFMT